MEVDENEWMTGERIDNLAKLSVCLLFGRFPKWIWNTLYPNMPWEAGEAAEKYIAEHSLILEEKGVKEADKYLKRLKQSIKKK